jgi:putative flippase GtrA
MSQFFQYFLISLGCLLVDLMTYWMLLKIHLSAPNAAVIAYVLGLLLAYQQMKKRIFKSGWLNDHRKSEFFMFLLSGVLGVAVTYLVVYFGTHVIGESASASKAAAVTLSFVSVFLFRKYLIFREQSVLPRK